MSEFAYPLDGEQNYTAAQCGAFFAGRTSGVFAAEENLKVTVTGPRQLTLSAGIAWITTDRYWGKVYCNDDAINFPLPVADGVLDMICRVVIRWNKTTNICQALLLEGAPSSSPVAPARSTTDELYDLVIADYLVQHGEINASAERLTDQRLNESLCGLMRDGVTGIPTAELQAQVETLIADLREQISNVAAGIISPSQIGAMGIGADNGAVGAKYTISIEPDTADKKTSSIKIIDNASGKVRAAIAANEDSNNAENETSQLVLRNSSVTGRISIQSNDIGKKGLRIIDENGVTRVDISHNTNGDTCEFHINDASGDDITLDTIGAQPARLTYSSSLVTSDWESDTTYTDYPYRATVVEDGEITAYMFAEVVLSPADATSGNFAPVCQTYAGGVYIYAKTVPDAITTIPTIIVWR